jgi:hypothetical protein
MNAEGDECNTGFSSGSSFMLATVHPFRRSSFVTYDYARSTKADAA